jgi:hypothetical protein
LPRNRADAHGLLENDLARSGKDARQEDQRSLIFSANANSRFPEERN